MILKTKDKDGNEKNLDVNTIIEEISGSKKITPMATYTNLGRINYGPHPYDYKNHGIKVKYSTTSETTTHQIKAYKGAIVDVVAAAISVIFVPQAIMSNFIRGLCYALGITVVSGEIKDSLTATLAANTTQYHFTLTDTLDANRSCTVEGGKSVLITETNSKYKGDIYEVAFLPKDWKTTTFGKLMYLSLFGVIGMTPVSHGSY